MSSFLTPLQLSGQGNGCGRSFGAKEMNNTNINLRAEDAQPTQRFVALLLSQAIYECAERMEFSLDDPSLNTGLRMAFCVRGVVKELHPAPGRLFTPMVIILCNHAGIAYYSKGKIEGSIGTTQPQSNWMFQAEDLTRAFTLVRTSPIKPIHERRPIDCGER